MKLIEKVHNKFLMKLQNEKTQLLTCFALTFIWAMITHGYNVFRYVISHDALNEFNAQVFGNDWKIELGRVLVPAYRMITRSYLTLPWLIGIMAFVWLFLSVYFVSKLFHTKNKMRIFLLAGVFTANITVTSTAATYLHDFDCNMFGLLLAVVAVYLWRKGKYDFLLGSIIAACAMAFYQSYISVTITLILILLIMDLLNEKKFSDIMAAGIKAVGMLLISGVVYFIMIKIISVLSNVTIEQETYNSLGNLNALKTTSVSKYWELFKDTYKEVFEVLWNSPTLFPEYLVKICLIGIFVFVCINIICGLLNRKIGIKEKLLILILFFLLPLGMNISNILNSGTTHILMDYAFWLILLFALVLAWEFDNKKLFIVVRLIPCILVFVFLWGNVQLSNAIYLKKDIEYSANLSFFTRVLYNIESFEGYNPETTKVVFVGKPLHLLDEISGFEVCAEVKGANIIYVPGVAHREYYVAYFDTVMQYKDIFADDDTWNRILALPQVKEMPLYPQEGSMQEIEGTLVIRLGE